MFHNRPMNGLACYGNAIQNDWRTTGVCTIQTLTTTDQISLYLESGGSSDCVQVTEYQKYFIQKKIFHSLRKQAGVTTACPFTWSWNLKTKQFGESISRNHQVQWTFDYILWFLPDQLYSFIRINKSNRAYPTCYIYNFCFLDLPQK